MILRISYGLKKWDSPSFYPLFDGSDRPEASIGTGQIRQHTAFGAAAYPSDAAGGPSDGADKWHW